MSRRSQHAPLTLLVLLALAAAGTGIAACEYQPKYQLLYPRDDVAPPPPLPDLGDLGADAPEVYIPDPGVYALYDRECGVCHPDYGRARGSGPELDGVLRHNSRASTQRFTRFGGGDMESLANRITDEQAAQLVAMLAGYGEGYPPPPAGQAEEGAPLFQEHCAHCHLEGGAVESLIPELTTLGAVTAGFLAALFDRQMGDMPRVELTEPERDAVIRYLQALPGGTPEVADAAVFAARCESCHAEGGRRRMRVPTVGQGGWLSSAGVRQLCVEGQGEMPPVLDALSDEQALDLQAYMRTVTPRRAAPGSWPPRALAATSPEAVARGESLLVARCRVCHGALGEERIVFPDIREAGYLHTKKYLREAVKQGVGDMPAFPELTQQEVDRLADQMVALSKEVRRTGPAVADDPLFHRHCEGCHQRGGRDSGVAPDLATAGQDLSEARLLAVLGDGFGAMGPTGLTAREKADLVAFFQRDLAPPVVPPALVAQARQEFGTWCEECHHDGGLAPTQIPGVGDVLARATTSYVDSLVQQGLGWMPAIPEAAGVLAPLNQALAQVAQGQQPAGEGLAAYDTHCRRCHLDPAGGDEAAALVRPTVVTTIGGRLSPAFVRDLCGGIGTMTPVVGLADPDASLRAYLDSIAGGPLRQATAIPTGGSVPQSRLAFDSLCGGCHREHGVAEVRLPKLAQKLRNKVPGTAYVMEFISKSNGFGSMPLLTLSGAERAAIQSYVNAQGNGQQPSEGAQTTYGRRCAGCHPESETAEAIVVPHLVPTGARLSARFVREASLRGVGTMAPAYRPDGTTPTEAEIDAVFPQLRWLVSQQGQPYTEQPLDQAKVVRGKTVYNQYCNLAACHRPDALGPTGVNLFPRQVGGRLFVPLEGLSAVLLERVTRRGMGVVAGQPGGMIAFNNDIPDGEMADLVEYMLALGRGQTP